jgi:hypothetical protein
MARAIWFPAKTLTSNATPKRRIGSAAWSFRSDVRSECEADHSIAGSAASHGIPEIKITWVWLKPEIRWTILGNQVPRPVLFVM